MVVFIIFPENIYLKKQYEYLMFVCTTVLYEYMEALKNGVNNLFENTHVRMKIYQEFYHGIIYIANERRDVRIYVRRSGLR